MKPYTICVMPDIQAPYEDRKFVKALIRFIGEYNPDEVVNIGDLADYPQPSRWSKDTRAEFEGSIYEDSDYIKRNVLEPLRTAYSGPIGVLEGNHDLRPREYLEKYAPALSGATNFNFENLLDFEGFDVTRLPDFYEFTSGWVMTHGHLANIRLSQISAQTALNAAKKLGQSVIMGHTHRLGIASHTEGYNAKVTRHLTGVEVGHAMDMRQATYLKKGTPNWQQGFAMVYVSGDVVQVDPIAVTKGTFIVEGETYIV